MEVYYSCTRMTHTIPTTSSVLVERAAPGKGSKAHATTFISSQLPIIYIFFFSVSPEPMVRDHMTSVTCVDILLSGGWWLMDNPRSKRPGHGHHKCRRSCPGSLFRAETRGEYSGNKGACYKYEQITKDF